MKPQKNDKVLLCYRAQDDNLRIIKEEVEVTATNYRSKKWPSVYVTNHQSFGLWVNPAVKSDCPMWLEEY